MGKREGVIIGAPKFRGRPQTGRRNPIATESDLRNAVNVRNHRDDHRRLAAFASGRFSNFKARVT